MKSQPLISCVALSLAGLLIGAQAFAQTQQHAFDHEHVLGTSLKLQVSAPNRQTAIEVESATLTHIDRLNAVFSRYDSNSELMRWQASNEAGPAAVSKELSSVLTRAESWRRETHGAFDVRAAAVSRLWRESTPDQSQRLALIKQLDSAPYEQTAQGVRRLDSLPISLDGLAKGYIIDSICEMIANRFPAVTDFSVNIGGDIRTVGRQPLSVAITDPRNPTEGAAPATRFTAERPMAIATSGGYRRHQKSVEGKHSHIVDPRTGLPANAVQSATVVAPTAMDADALATALCVLTPTESLALVESTENTECFLILANGQRLASPGWPGEKTWANEHFVDNTKPETGLLVDFTLARPKGGKRYRRPYVAVWLEDKDGYPVKTAILWMQTDQPGPRWHRDLTRWYRNDRVRKVAEEKNLIGVISSATRGPGEYQAKFDGADNAGNPLPEGDYTLCIEVAREHGTYQIIREPVKLGEQPVAKKELKGNVEVSTVSLEYIPPANASAAKTQ